MKCPYCKCIEWLYTKTIEEFDLEGCIKNRLIIGNDLICEPNEKKKVRNDYRVNGRMMSSISFSLTNLKIPK